MSARTTITSGRAARRAALFRARADGRRVCNGATDNAAGVAAALAIGEALRTLPKPPRRSVVLALWDAEEDGLLGSLYYVDHPWCRCADGRLRELRHPRRRPAAGPARLQLRRRQRDRRRGAAQASSTRAAAGPDLDVRKFSYIFGQSRSDYNNFVARRRPDGVLLRLDRPLLPHHRRRRRRGELRQARQQSAVAFRTVVALAEASGAAGLRPPNPAVAVFDDAVSLQQCWPPQCRPTCRPLRARRPGADQSDQGSAVDQIVADGPAQFDAATSTPSSGCGGADRPAHRDGLPRVLIVECPEGGSSVAAKAARAAGRTTRNDWPRRPCASLRDLQSSSQIRFAVSPALRVLLDQERAAELAGPSVVCQALQVKGSPPWRDTAVPTFGAPLRKKASARAGGVDDRVARRVGGGGAVGVASPGSSWTKLCWQSSCMAPAGRGVAEAGGDGDRQAGAAGAVAVLDHQRVDRRAAVAVDEAGARVDAHAEGAELAAEDRRGVVDRARRPDTARRRRASMCPPTRSSDPSQRAERRPRCRAPRRRTSRRR